MPQPFFSCASHRSLRPLAGLRPTLALLTALAAGCTVTPAAPPAPEPTQAVAPQFDPQWLATFTTRLSGANEVPPVASSGLGQVDALLDRRTRLLRWKMSFSRLSGPVTGAHFHGPAAVGANAGVALLFPVPVTSPYEGRVTLTEQQAADLLAGRWYVNLHTARHPGGEIRGQMIERK